MKKIPTLFERVFAGHKIVGIIDKIKRSDFGLEWNKGGKIK